RRRGSVRGAGAVAVGAGHRVVVGTARLAGREHLDLGPLAARREALAAGGRTVVVVGVDGRAAGLIAIADAPRETAAAAVAAPHEAGIEGVVLTGGKRGTAGRGAARAGGARGVGGV